MSQYGTVVHSILYTILDPDSTLTEATSTVDVFEAMTQRRAIRAYQDKPIEADKLERVLDSLRLAPSGNNRQPTRFCVVRDQELKHKLVKQACHQSFIEDAAVIVVACCEKGGEFDAAISMDHLTLAAVAEGLGTCWIKWYDKPAAGLILNVPDTHEVAAIMPLGYAAEEPAARPRLPLAELIYDNTF